MNYEIVGECSPTKVATFECGDICGNRRMWEEHPAAGSNASSSSKYQEIDCGVIATRSKFEN